VHTQRLSGAYPAVSASSWSIVIIIIIIIIVIIIVTRLGADNNAHWHRT